MEANDDKALIPIALVHLGDIGQFFYAGIAPRSPKVEQHYFAL